MNAKALTEPALLEKTRQLSSAEVRLLQLDMLGKLVAFLEDQGLSYSLCGGTLLGAVRHRGFIPWDDDIDIMLPRPHYQRLRELAALGGLGPDLALVQGPAGEPPAFPFLKLVHLRTRIDLDLGQAYGIPHVWIDVLPMDGLPQDASSVGLIYWVMKKLRTLLVLKDARDSSSVYKWKAVLKPALRWGLQRTGTSFIVQTMEWLAQLHHFDDSFWIGVVTWGLYGPGERMARQPALSTVTLEFEGMSLRAVGCWHEYLSGIYGDYMTPPPPEKRIAHRYVAWLQG